MNAHWRDVEQGGEGASRLGLRVYSSAATRKLCPLVLYLHGGAFLKTDRVEQERVIPRAIAETGSIVIEADYGAMSDYRFPDVLEHACEALHFVDLRRKELGGTVRSPLLVVGEEAGGNVAAGVALKARDRFPGRLTGQILLSPLIDPRMTSVSMREAEVALREKWSDGWRHYMRAVSGGQHPYAAPCQCSRLGGLAPALLMTSQDDPLRDEGLAYADRLKEAGARVTETILPASAGWTDIYKTQTGPWIEAVSAGFSAFVKDIRSQDRVRGN